MCETTWGMVAAFLLVIIMSMAIGWRAGEVARNEGEDLIGELLVIALFLASVLAFANDTILAASGGG